MASIVDKDGAMVDSTSKSIIDVQSPRLETFEVTQPPFSTSSSRRHSQSHLNGDKADYFSYMKSLYSAWEDAPVIDITYENIQYDIELPINDTSIPNMLKSLISMMKLPYTMYYDYVNANANKNIQILHALKHVTGSIRAGEMSLILSPPGGGKSAFLKALSGQLHDQENFHGCIRYNGLTSQEAKTNGLRLNKLAIYCNQTDAHLPTLTVRETLEFALNNVVVDPASYYKENEQLKTLHQQKLDFIIELLNLEEAQNTIVGNDLLRGISGGQKKRLTIGEMLITNARILALDEITNGLDSAVAYDINKSIRDWVKLSKATVVTALLQPTPETYSLFDNVILLMDGFVLYQGPREEVIPYVESLGAVKPAGVDDGDFLINFLTNPEKYMNQSSATGALNVRRADGHDADETSSTSVSTDTNNYSNDKIHEHPRAPSNTNLQSLHDSISNSVQDVSTYRGNSVLSPAQSNKNLADSLDGSNKSLNDYKKHYVSSFEPPIYKQTIHENKKSTSAAVIAEYFTHTIYYSNMLQDVQAAKKLHDTEKAAVQPSGYTAHQYSKSHALNFWNHVQLNIRRQAKIVSRDYTQWMPRFATAIIMGLILGGLFFNIPSSDYGDRLGLMLFSVTNSAFANMAELPAVDAAKPTVYKQLDHSFYPSTSYIIAYILINIPIQIIECMIMSSTVYWMTNFVPDVGRFFFFFLCIFATNLVLSVWFRSISYSTANQFIAQQIDGPVIGIAMVFGGFLITRSKIPIWLIEFYWLSPFSWIVHSMALNEYHSLRYYNSQGVDVVGNQYLLTFEMYTDEIYKWMGILYMAGLFVIGTIFCAFLLHTKRFELSIGTKRITDVDELLNNPDDEIVKIDLARQHSSSSKLPFIPVTVAWRNISYVVPIKGQEDRTLLTEISGFCRPGEMTALMGSSGAGKTTLMDVIAGRKTAGTMQGEILLNGIPKEDKAFAALVGYCEQQDLHMGFATVRESLLFSATLRLPASVSKEIREEFVDEVLTLLELDKIQHRIIGDESYQSLSPAQKKLVTIGVELSANPSVIFLDEPTSGLDARSALLVMRVVRRIAATGRTVLCTIHQPSSEVFFLFDRLLLLRSGGKTAYFGDVGTEGEKLISYLENNVNPSNPHKCPIGVNPATWMLDVIADKDIDVVEIYKKSSLNEESTAELQEACQPSMQRQSSIMVEGTRPNTYVQFYEVFKRENLMYWRNTGFNYTRAITQLALGIIFGLVFLKLNISGFAGIQSLRGGIFMALGFGGILNTSTVMPVIAAERAVFYRERSSKMYSAWSYGFTLMFVEVPHVVLGAVLYVLPFYWLMGLRADAAIFFRYFAMQVFFGFCMNAVGHGLAALLPNIVAATQLQGLLLTFVFLFAGVFIGPNSMPAGWRWIWTINPLAHALGPLILDQTENDYELLQLPDQPDTNIHDYSTNSIGMDYGTYAVNFGWLVLITVVVRVLALLSLRYVSHIKR